MPQFTVGQRVQADITGALPILGPGSFTPATIVAVGEAPGTVTVQTDSPFNGVSHFRLTLDRIS